MIQSINKPQKVYIGSSMNLDGRKRTHFEQLKRNTHHNPILQAHFNKYGKEDLEFSVLESREYVGLMHLLAREQGWFIPYSFDGVGLPYFNVNKIAGSRLGTKNTEEQRKRQSDRQKGTVPWNKGKKNKVSEEVRKKMNEACKKPIFQYDLNMVFIKEWSSSIDAALALSIDSSSITKVLKNITRRTAGGFVWRYKFNKKVA